VTRVKPFLRIGALFAALFVLAVVVLSLCIRARAHELMQGAGAAMLSYGRAEHLDGPHVLSLNGARLHLLSGTTRDSVGALLDAFHARCKQVGGGFGRQLARLRPQLDALSPSKRAAFDAVLRADGERAGHLACLDLGGAPIDARELQRRVQAFLATGDLAKVGELRLVWATRDRDRTRYIALWSEGSLPLLAMFPAHEDAPGLDAPELPRPSGTRRLLSALQEQQAAMLVAYRSQGTPQQLELRYSRELTTHGFLASRLKQPPGQPQAMLLRRGQIAAAATFLNDGHGGTTLTLVRLR
jgi:hypothetical protein